MIWVVLVLRYLVLVLLLIFMAWAGRSVISDQLLGGKQRSAVLAVLSSTSPVVPAGANWEIGHGVTIGRKAECDIRVPEAVVSGKHARVFQSGGEYFAEDLGSTNGTFVDGRPLRQPSRIRSGAKIQVGPVAFAFKPGARGRRRNALFLDLFPGIFLASGGATLYLNKFLQANELIMMLAVSAFICVSSLAFRYAGKGDHFFFLVISMLTSLGLIFLYRINPAYGVRQTYWAFIGITLFWLTQIFLRHYGRLLDYKYLIMVLSILFLVLTISIGTTAGGARSWLNLGSFRFQPSELVKIFMVIFLAGYLDENKEILTRGTIRIGPFLVPDWRYLGPLFLACGLSLVLLVFQKDLGMALLFFTIFMGMVYAATDRFSYLVSGMVLFFVGAYLMYLIFPHVQERVAVFLDPWSMATTGGYQVIQSLFALSGGGLFGWGLGGGFPTLIPAVHTDFIFSLIGEELGLAGEVAIIALYGFIVWRGMKVALRQQDGFGRLLAFGFSAMLALQSLIILGGVADVIPLTGITLPFLSYGGSSFVSNCFLVGMLMKISEDQPREQGRARK